MDFPISLRKSMFKSFNIFGHAQHNQFEKIKSKLLILEKELFELANTFVRMPGNEPNP